mmetsp:Transcript_42238/g.99072  ORF Transcript_42238/g.99072 Transcript_42238/m.99072 type:complete len:242 (-) Transcript_42238:1002-1727(-)
MPWRPSTRGGDARSWGAALSSRQSDLRPSVAFVNVFLSQITSAWRRSHVSTTLHNVVDLEDHPHALRRQRHGAHVDQCRLHHVLLQDVGDGPLADVEPGVLLPTSVPRAQLGYDRDRVQPSVLGESVGDHFKRVCEATDARALCAGEGLGELAEAVLELHLGSRPAGDEQAHLVQRPHHTQRVMDGPLVLLKHQLVAPTAEDRHRWARLGDAGDLDDLASWSLKLLDKVGLAEFLRLQPVG